MCGLAELLHNMGATVWGSDIQANANTKRLEELGIEVLYGHQASNLRDADVVVYTSAVKADHIELLTAKELKIPRIPRAEVLAEIMRLKRSIAVGGSHGKTTTTSLLASVLIGAGKKPTVVVGGRLDLIKSTSILGEGEWLVAEADESDGSFLKYKPEIAIITNIDNDHMDFYENERALENAFLKFAEQVPFYGKVFACGDCDRTRRALEPFKKHIVYYGFHETNDYQLMGSDGKYQVLQNGELAFSFELAFPGKHYALNSLAALLVGMETGLSSKEVTRALSHFSGVGRRFEKKGEYNGALVYDDYAHHPTEIRYTLEAFQEKHPDRKVRLVFQPHRYSRTSMCWQDFQTCFTSVDELLLLPIYAAGEEAMANITSENLLEAIDLENKKYFSSQEEVLKYLKETSGPEDILVTFGAGDISKLGDRLIQNAN